MRIVLQRAAKARVTIDKAEVGRIGRGIVVLLAVHRDDAPADAGFLARKCAELRIFPDDHGAMNRSLVDVNGEALVVSQFTLYGDCRKGRRPSFTDAAGPDTGRRLYEHFVGCLRQLVGTVQTGVFGAMMEVELVNDGPVTLILEKGHTSVTGDQ